MAVQILLFIYLLYGISHGFDITHDLFTLIIVESGCFVSDMLLCPSLGTLYIYSVCVFALSNMT